MIQVHLLLTGPSTTSTGLNLRLEFLEDVFAIVHFPTKYLTNKDLLLLIVHFPTKYLTNKDLLNDPECREVVSIFCVTKA